MSTNIPDWLPDPLDTNGSWDEILDRLWAVFDTQIAHGLFLNGHPVWHSNRIDDGKPEGFWHVTHRDDWVFDPRLHKKVKQRNFDPGRARCLCWLRPILENPHREEVLVWDYREDDGRIVTYVWLECCDYVIILGHFDARFGLVYRIITAYITDDWRKREQLREKHAHKES